MSRITLLKMMVLLRLAIVVSLAVYSLPTAAAGMHVPWSNSSIVQSESHHETASSDSGDDTSGAHGTQKISKQQCCKGFCASMAIVAGASAAGNPHVASIREFIDDAHIIGEIPSLHRPPNI